MIKSYPQHNLNLPISSTSSFSFNFLHHSSIHFYKSLSLSIVLPSFMFSFDFSSTFFDYYLQFISYFLNISFLLHHSPSPKVTTSLCYSTLQIHQSQVWLFLIHSELVQLLPAITQRTNIQKEKQEQQHLQSTRTSLAIIIHEQPFHQQWISFITQMHQPVFHLSGSTGLHICQPSTITKMSHKLPTSFTNQNEAMVMSSYSQELRIPSQDPWTTVTVHQSMVNQTHQTVFHCQLNVFWNYLQEKLHVSLHVYYTSNVMSRRFTSRHVTPELHVQVCHTWSVCQEFRNWHQ